MPEAEESQKNFFLGQINGPMTPKSTFGDRKRSAVVELKGGLDNFNVQKSQKVPTIPDKHKARYVYSQVYLGSDNEDEKIDRSASPASKFKGHNFPKPVYE